jgi:ribosomal protein S27AE
MSKFIKHIPCPRCGSKDNLAEYSDHYFCFGCKYNKPKNDLKSIRNKLKVKEVLEETNLQLQTTFELPTVAKQWLFKYGITPQEIEEFNFSWDESKSLLILINHPNFWQGRVFNDSFPTKYRNTGSKPLTYYGFADTIVLVEDVLSAVKIARLSPQVCACPLFGSSVPDEWVRTLSERFKIVKIWLDRDKASNAVKIMRSFRSRGIESDVVVTPNDPKEYSTQEIHDFLKLKKEEND